MDKEFCWMILGITGLLSQIGGTWAKWARRYIIPILIAGMAWYYIGFQWKLIPMMLMMYGVFCLPITLKGNGIPDHWVNWIWIPMWAILLCSSVLWLNIYYWECSIICGILLSTMVILSNINLTQKYFQWKMVEFFEGVFPIIPICYLITLHQ